MKRIICIILIVCICCMFAGCGSNGKTGSSATPIGFSDAVSLDTIKQLDGKPVSINGYMATLSPISGKYTYLMNMPYQSCPFCVPNTSQLSNTIAVYAPEGKTFEFTDNAVNIQGILKVEDYVDEYGYSYNYRIIDASMSIIDLSAISNEYALWQTIAADGIVGDINSMFDYLYFICCWPEYTMQISDENGNPQTVNLYPGDVDNILMDTGVYGYASYRADDYFPGLKARVNAISSTELSDLIAVIDSAKELETYALSELSGQNFTYDPSTDQYTLNNAEDLYNRWREVYLLFSQWLAKWQL